MVVVGTRPNFMKVTRFREVASRRGDLRIRLVHTGQHTDHRMSQVFFEEFGMLPDHWLGAKEGTPAARIARMMAGLEQVIEEHRPTAVVVVGDVDSTLAAAITANKCGVPLVHLESGLRSHDRTMPEELNRAITDRLSDVLLTSEPSGRENLLREGIGPERIHFVGNTMIDTLVACDPRIQADPVLDEMGLGRGGHVLLTMHRPATVDGPEGLQRLVAMVRSLAEQGLVVVFPLHPRTERNLAGAGLLEPFRAMAGVYLTGPLPYLAFQRLLSTSAFVITDSGGVQEETTFRGVPCLTLRPSTERPVTITEGTNRLITFDPGRLEEAVRQVREEPPGPPKVPELWDGHATERVFEVLMRIL